MSPRSDCVATGCPAPVVGTGELGTWLCLAHVLAALAPPAAPAVTGPERPDLRGRCWGESLTCSLPAQAPTAHGTWCAEHRPGHRTPAPPRQVANPAGSDRAWSEELVEALVVVAAGFPGAVLSTERAYGPAEQAYGHVA